VPVARSLSLSELAVPQSAHTPRGLPPGDPLASTRQRGEVGGRANHWRSDSAISADAEDAVDQLLVGSAAVGARPSARQTAAPEALAVHAPTWCVPRP